MATALDSSRTPEEGRTPFGREFTAHPGLMASGESEVFTLSAKEANPLLGSIGQLQEEASLEHQAPATETQSAEPAEDTPQSAAKIEGDNEDANPSPRRTDSVMSGINHQIPQNVVHATTPPASAHRNSTLGQPPNTLNETQPPEKPKIGKKIAWKKGRVIGSGAFGKVFVGMDKNTGRLVAAKEFKFDPADSEVTERVAKLQREIQIMKELEHPNIVNYLGADRVDTDFYIFMEFVPGGSVQGLLHDCGPLEESIVSLYAAQILTGLGFLHKSHVVHRDIKCANTLVTCEGVIKLADFGSAHHRKTGMKSGELEMEGTINWMAPEVIREKPQFSSDIWSLGCTITEMLTGKRPWHHLGNPMAVMRQVGACLDTGNHPSYPPELENISLDCFSFLELCFEPNPMRRPTAKSLLTHPFIIRQLANPNAGSPGERGPFDPEYYTSMSMAGSMASHASHAVSLRREPSGATSLNSRRISAPLGTTMSVNTMKSSSHSSFAPSPHGQAPPSGIRPKSEMSRSDYSSLSAVPTSGTASSSFGGKRNSTPGVQNSPNEGKMGLDQPSLHLQSFSGAYEYQQSVGQSSTSFNIGQAQSSYETADTKLSQFTLRSIDGEIDQTVSNLSSQSLKSFLSEAQQASILAHVFRSKTRSDASIFRGTMDDSTNSAAVDLSAVPKLGGSRSGSEITVPVPKSEAKTPQNNHPLGHAAPQPPSGDETSSGGSEWGVNDHQLLGVPRSSGQGKVATHQRGHSSITNTHTYIDSDHSESNSASGSSNRINKLLRGGTRYLTDVTIENEILADMAEDSVVFESQPADEEGKQQVDNGHPPPFKGLLSINLDHPEFLNNGEQSHNSNSNSQMASQTRRLEYSHTLPMNAIPGQSLSDSRVQGSQFEHEQGALTSVVPSSGSFLHSDPSGNDAVSDNSTVGFTPEVRVASSSHNSSPQPNQRLLVGIIAFLTLLVLVLLIVVIVTNV